MPRCHEALFSKIFTSFDLVFFCRREIGQRAAHKMLLKFDNRSKFLEDAKQKRKEVEEEKVKTALMEAEEKKARELEERRRKEAEREREEEEERR